MKILTNREIFTPPSPAIYLYQILTFDDGTQEYDAYCSQTTAILTAELKNGQAARDDNGNWVPAPGLRNHYWDTEILGFKVGLTYWQHDGEGKAIFEYTVVTPTNVTFEGNSLTVPSNWGLERIAAEAITWVCVSTGDGVGSEFFANYDAYQLTWRDSLNREYANGEIIEYIERMDRGETEPQVEDEPMSQLELAQIVLSAPDPVDLDAIAKQYVADYIYACQSGVVEKLLSLDDDYLSFEDITNVYPDTDRMDADDLAEYISDNFGVDWRDLIDITDYAVEIEVDSHDTQDETTDNVIDYHALRSDLNPFDLNEWDVDLLRDHIRDHAEPREIFEWWLVNSWFAAQLEGIGECTINDGSSFWWGRTCTGQAIYLDGTLQKIAAKFNS